MQQRSAGAVSGPSFLRARGMIPPRTSGSVHHRVGRMAWVGLLLVATSALSLAESPAADAATAMPASTSSHYEVSADPGTLAAQGAAAGNAGAQGLAILDFGRPAFNGSTSGTMDFGGSFISLTSIVAATVGYVEGYFTHAPRGLRLEVAIGTNNSCGTGQPCGSVVCGCNFEPTSFYGWGEQQAVAVEQAESQVSAVRARSGYTDLVTVVAGDDAEPAFDPGYQNTHDLLAGYARAVGGYQPSMIDYGSADRGFWSNDQLLQVADGFSPDVAVPEIYYPSDAASWASLISYAKSKGRIVTVFGVLTSAPNGLSPQVAYSSAVNSIEPITGQTAIRWASQIGN